MSKRSSEVKEVGFAAVGLSTWTYFSTPMFGAYLAELAKQKSKRSRPAVDSTPHKKKPRKSSDTHTD
jgi:hypothetical protein